MTISVAGIDGSPVSISVSGTAENADETTNVTQLYLQTKHGLRLRPSVNVTIDPHPLSRKKVTIRTNTQGYRGAVITPKKRPRMFVLGDSITMSDHLNEEETLPAQIESLLDGKGEVINSGVVGLGTRDEAYVLEESGFATLPDRVLLVFYLNDALPSPSAQPLRTPDILSWSYAAGHVLKVVSTLAAIVRPPRDPVSEELLNSWYQDFSTGNGKELPALVHQNFGDWGNSWSTGAWKEISTQLDRVAALCAKHAIPLTVVAWPVRFQVEGTITDDFPQQQLAEWGSKNGVQVIDLLNVFRAAWKEDQAPLFYDPCHPTLRGTRLAATEIVRVLKQPKIESSYSAL